VGPTCQTPRTVPGPRGSGPGSSRALKALLGPRAGVVTVPSRPSRPPPDRLAAPARRLTPRAAASTAHVPTAAVRSHIARTAVMPPRPPRRSPVAVAPHCRPRAGEPPVSSAVSRASVPCRRWLAVQRHRRTLRRRARRACSHASCAVHCAGRPSWAAHAAPAEANPGRPRVAVDCARGPRQRREHGPCPTWLWAVRSHGRGPRPRCATGPSVVSAQWHSVKFYIF
jgi:hypothetical protein